MKLFWKIFLSMTGVMIMILSFVSSFIIHDTFQNSIEKEIDSAVNENRVILYTFRNALKLSHKNDRAEVSVKDLQDILSPFQLGQKDVYTVNVYELNRLVYQTGNKVIEHKMEADGLKENQCKYRIIQLAETHYLEIASMARLGSSGYVLNVFKNVQDSFDNGAYMTEKFRDYMMIAVLMSIVVSFVTSRLLTRPVKKLTETVCRMSDGDYDCRADVHTTGEVAVLVRQFNAMAERLSENMEKLKAEAEKQEEFTAAFAHELKTPLTSVIGYADMLRSRNLTEQKRRKYSEYIFSQGKRLEKLSHELLNLILLDRQEIEMQQIAMEDFTENIKSVFRTIPATERIRFSVSFGNGRIWGNRELLQSLFYNLIDNSRKAIGADGAITVVGEMAEKQYKILIIDNGCGMKKEELGKVRQAFYMVDKSRAGGENSAGIGLALCEKIISLHHGTWEIRSAPQKGTTVTVLFPAMTGREGS